MIFNIVIEIIRILIDTIRIFFVHFQWEICLSTLHNKYNNIASAKFGIHFPPTKNVAGVSHAFYQCISAKQFLNFSCLLSPCGRVVCHFRWWKEGNPGFRRRLFDGLSVCAGGLGGVLHASSSPHLDEGSHYPISPVISAAETFVFRSSFGQPAMRRARGGKMRGFVKT